MQWRFWWLFWTSKPCRYIGIVRSVIYSLFCCNFQWLAPLGSIHYLCPAWEILRCQLRIWCSWSTRSTPCTAPVLFSCDYQKSVILFEPSRAPDRQQYLLDLKGPTTCAPFLLKVFLWLELSGLPAGERRCWLSPVRMLPTKPDIMVENVCRNEIFLLHRLKFFELQKYRTIRYANLWYFHFFHSRPVADSIGRVYSLNNIGTQFFGMNPRMGWKWGVPAS